MRGSSTPPPNEHRDPTGQSLERHAQSQRQELPQQLAPSAVESQPAVSNAMEALPSALTAALGAGAEGDEYWSAEETLPEGSVISRASSLANEITLATEAAVLAPLKLVHPPPAEIAAGLLHPSRSLQSRSSIEDQAQAPYPTESLGTASVSQSARRTAPSVHRSPTSPPRLPDVAPAAESPPSPPSVSMAQTGPIPFADPLRGAGRAHTLPAAADHAGRFSSGLSPRPPQQAGSHSDHPPMLSPHHQVGDPSVPSPQPSPQEAASTPAGPSEGTPPEQVKPDSFTAWDFVSPRLSSRPSG